MSDIIEEPPQLPIPLGRVLLVFPLAERLRGIDEGAEGIVVALHASTILIALGSPADFDGETHDTISHEASELVDSEELRDAGCANPSMEGLLGLLGVTVVS